MSITRKTAPPSSCRCPLTRGLLGLLALGLAASAAVADFVPGRVYVSARHAEGCLDPGQPNERIYEIDPVTGESRVFVIMPEEHCGVLTGLAFTPDYSRLRASVALKNEIIAVDGNAGIEVALDRDDGIGSPVGSNNIAYDAAGNFFVSNLGGSRILKFPADGGPGEMFANTQGVGPLAPAMDGGLFYAELNTVWYYSATGKPTVFDQLANIESLAVDVDGRLFVQTGNGIFLYEDPADPASRRTLVDEFVGGTSTSIAIAPSGAELYFAQRNEFRVFSLSTGAELRRFQFDPVPPLGVEIGSGIAVFVPEPASVCLCMTLLALLSRGTRRKRHFKDHQHD